MPDYQGMRPMRPEIELASKILGPKILGLQNNCGGIDVTDERSAQSSEQTATDLDVQLYASLSKEAALAAQLLGLAGCEKREIAIGVNRLIKGRTGRDFLEETGWTNICHSRESDSAHLEDGESSQLSDDDFPEDEIDDGPESSVMAIRPVEEIVPAIKEGYLTTSQIGSSLAGLNAAAIDLLLERHGYQTRREEHWMLTKKGKAFGCAVGRPGTDRHIEWAPAIMDRLRGMIISGGEEEEAK